MLIRLRHEEKGLAMVIAIMISFIILTLSIFVIQLSIHNSNQSAYDRRRVTSVAAAEAGIDAVWATIQSTVPQNLPCSSPATGTLGSSPGTATYSVTVTYYQSSGAALVGCPSQSNVPVAALLTSTGTTDSGATRKMQAYATLTPIQTGIGAAIISNTGTSFTNNFTLNGNGSDNADIYINSGDVAINSSPTVHGTIYVHAGAYSQGNNSIISGSVWANGAMTINSPAIIQGSATSSTSSISKTTSSGGTVNSNATAGTTIDSGISVGGTKVANSPQSAPPSQALPIICWTSVTGCTGVSSTWTASPYNYTSLYTGSDCSAARTALTTGTITGNRYVSITGTCNLNIQNSDSITFTGNLGIFTNGSITLSQQNNWNGSTGNSLFFVANYQASPSCGTYPSTYDITTSNNANFNNVSVSFYSPCTVNIANQNTFSGQVFAGTAKITNLCTINFTPVLVPGSDAANITGFTQSIVYVRESQ